MIIYNGDFILSETNKTIIKELSLCNSTSIAKVYNIDRDIYIEGLGEVSVKLEIDTLKGLNIKTYGLKIDRAEELNIRKRELEEIIAVYKIYIKVNGKEAALLINVKLDKDNFTNTTDYLLEELRILKYKTELSLTDDLLFYMENLDLNYIINIIYGAFIIHAYKLLYPHGSDTNMLEVVFVSKLEKIGFIIPKPNADTLRQVELIVDMINNLKIVKPESMAIVLINTLPSNPLSKSYRIDDVVVLYSSIYEVISVHTGIECL